MRDKTTTRKVGGAIYTFETIAWSVWMGNAALSRNMGSARIFYVGERPAASIFPKVTHPCLWWDWRKMT
ncbi:hypothetical protein QG37_03045 [Candidozyma auris]|uniref:Uncharacterized protein n=1 Tax=Candidozyma auris TaxID=498019 RepID=A0A0L0P273_CANAR|nr:hypothetical protein QG37_03045 [[Candida] auris]